MKTHPLRQPLFKLFPLLAAFLFFIAPAANAAEIINVKNNKALIRLDETEASAEQEFFALDHDGKKKALLKVTAAKNGKALADILKGKAEVGYTISPRNSPVSSPSSDDAEHSSTFTRKYTGNSWGLLGSLTQTTMNVSIPVTAGSSTMTTIPMTGSNFGVVGFYDYAYQPHLILRGIGGYEQLTANGTSASASCDGSANCNFEVSYLSFYGILRYNYMMNKWKPWVGVNFGMLIAMGKSSNVIDTAGITTNQIYGVNTGLDIPLSRKSYLPLSLEYGMFPSSSTVTSSFLTIRAGYAWYY